MSLTGKDIAEIARLLDASNFTSLDLQLGDLKLRIRRDGDGGGRWQDDARDDPVEEDEAVVTVAASPAPAPTQASAAGAGEVDVIAPLLGNYYASPRPGEDPFVAVGDRVEEDTIIAIIEVMKLMNSVRAGVSGIVNAVLVQNGSAVEAGEALIRVQTDG